MKKANEEYFWANANMRSICPRGTGAPGSGVLGGGGWTFLGMRVSALGIRGPRRQARSPKMMFRFQTSYPLGKFPFPSDAKGEHRGSLRPSDHSGILPSSVQRRIIQPIAMMIPSPKTRVHGAMEWPG